MSNDFALVMNSLIRHLLQKIFDGYISSDDAVCPYHGRDILESESLNIGHF